jgi:hypothetical protein
MLSKNNTIQRDQLEMVALDIFIHYPIASVPNVSDHPIDQSNDKIQYKS